MPRLGEAVSDSECRVPKPTSACTVACSCLGSGLAAISRKMGCSALSVDTAANIIAAPASSLAQRAFPPMRLALPLRVIARYSDISREDARGGPAGRPPRKVLPVDLESLVV